MTKNEQEQFAAKQQSKYYHNTHCGQCNDIVRQKPRILYDFLLSLSEQTYWCRCKYELAISPTIKDLLRKF
jgi:hypothetical protein